MLEIFGRRTEVVSRAPSAASARGARMRPAAPANESVVRKRRRVWVIGIGILLSLKLRLQLAFDLVQKAPVGAVSDDLLRTAFDHAELVHPQRVKANRVFGVVFPPGAVGVLGQCLQRIVITFG